MKQRSKTGSHESTCEHSNLDAKSDIASNCFTLLFFFYSAWGFHSTKRADVAICESKQDHVSNLEPVTCKNELRTPAKCNSKEGQDKDCSESRPIIDVFYA